MSLYGKLGMNECETADDLINAISQETELDEKELWSFAYAIVVEGNLLENGINEARLRLLFDLHLNSVVNDWDYTGNPPAKWVKITIPIDGAKDSDFTFSYGAFNVPVYKDQQRIEAMENLAEDEGLEIRHHDEDVIFTEHQEYDSVRALHLTGRILDEVYGLDFADMIQAENVIAGSESAGSTWKSIGVSPDRTGIDVDLEVIEPSDVNDFAYPMAKELQVEDMRVQKGDLVFSSGGENTDDTWGNVYGFDWGGIYTDFIGELQMPRFREWSDFVTAVQNGDLQVVRLQEETSFYVDDETVQTLSLYRTQNKSEEQHILLEQARHPLETRNKSQSLENYKSADQMVDGIYTPDALTTVKEAEAVYELLIKSGVCEDGLTPPDEISNQSGLDTFTG